VVFCSFDTGLNWKACCERAKCYSVGVSYKTVEVELENGHVRPSGAESLPDRAHGLLTLLDHGTSTSARTCGELAERWATLDTLPPDEANAFADDVERSRSSLPAPKAAWD
jgi:hypothetical protein